MEKLTIKPIRDVESHGQAMERIDALMSLDDLSDDQVAELEVLAILVERYESEHFPVKFPSPVEAIEFRMDQLGINRSQLAKLIDLPKSRVSEVLNGKRNPSLGMMRALNDRLKIPAEVLLGKPKAQIPEPCPGVKWKSFPINEMFNHGWLGKVKPKADEIEGCIRALMASARVQSPQFAGVHFRGTENKEPNPYSVNAWLMKAKADAINRKSEHNFCSREIGHNFRREVAKLSLYSDGPRRAFEKLQLAGITAVYVPFLHKTYIDGACFQLPSGKPAIALSLRYNRLDNFWFTLLHECAHVERHLSKDQIILDEIERQTGAFGNNPDLEDEANDLARRALVPDDIFQELAQVAGSISASKVRAFARRADVHEAVIAGEVRRMTRQYSHFSNLVGQGKAADALRCVRP